MLILRGPALSLLILSHKYRTFLFKFRDTSVAVRTEYKNAVLALPGDQLCVEKLVSCCYFVRITRRNHRNCLILRRECS
jgi:hypothetical protein